MLKDKDERKSVDLDSTQVWRDSEATITMGGDFDPISFHRGRQPADWAKLDRLLRSRGK